MNFKKSRERKIIKVSELLEKLVKEKRWDKHFALGRLKNDWHRIVGSASASHTTPSYIKNKKLFIEVDSPIWANQLNFLKLEIINTINNYYNKKVVNDIFFKTKAP